MSTIALGPFMIRADILIFLLSAIVGFIVLRIRLRDREESSFILDTYVNALIIGFVVWKFSMIVFDPIRTIQNPLSLLYFTGGDKGILLGTALALLYIGFRLNQNKLWIIPLLKASILAYLAGAFTRCLFLWLWDESLWIVGLMNVILQGVFLVLVWMKYDGSIRVFNSLALWYSIGSVLIPFFDPNRYTVVAGFNSVQITFGIVAFALLLLDVFLSKSNKIG